VANLERGAWVERVGQGFGFRNSEAQRR
jgi:hypothetical protein